MLSSLLLPLHDGGVVLLSRHSTASFLTLAFQSILFSMIWLLANPLGLDATIIPQVRASCAAPRARSLRTARGLRLLSLSSFASSCTDMSPSYLMCIAAFRHCFVGVARCCVCPFARKHCVLGYRTWRFSCVVVLFSSRNSRGVWLGEQITLGAPLGWGKKLVATSLTNYNRFERVMTGIYAIQVVMVFVFLALQVGWCLFGSWCLRGRRVTTFCVGTGCPALCSNASLPHRHLYQ